MKLKSPKGFEIIIKNPRSCLINWDKKSRSDFQFQTKAFLRPFWKHDLVFEEFTVPKTRLSLDIFNFSRSVAIEVQGQQHTKYSPFFHGNTRYKYLTQLKRDQQKLDFCDKYGIVLVEIYNLSELTEDFFKNHGVIL